MDQTLLFPGLEESNVRDSTSSTFTNNMKIPVHRWFRFSAGFSAEWAEKVILDNKNSSYFSVLDPFAGSGTTLLAAEKMGVRCFGVEAHPFISRIAKAKLFYRTCPDKYLKFSTKVKDYALTLKTKVDDYPELINKCFHPQALEFLDKLRKAWIHYADHSPESELTWVTLISILRAVSHAGTAPWQYVLPSKTKRFITDPKIAYESMTKVIYSDMKTAQFLQSPKAELFASDARTCEGVKDNSIDLVLTSPPYANNYDYADAMRLEMSFMKEVEGWGDLNNIRKYLIRSCSQHVPESSNKLDEVLSDPLFEPIKKEISLVCHKLAEVRHSHGGKKTYHLMVACYFLDIAKVWQSLRRVCKSDAKVCFVVGDSAPYGVYVPVIEWMGNLAKVAGFQSYSFEKTRDRNVKWKNRKHRVPLCEGRLWVKS